MSERKRLNMTSCIKKSDERATIVHILGLVM